jgi:KaiC/GvpD/RAD55 family RecA-like ATPase
MMNFAQRINFDALMEPVALCLLGEPTQKHENEWRYGNRGSLSIDLAKGRWFDHEAKRGGGVFDLIRRMGHDQPAAWLRREGLMPQPHVVDRADPKIVKTYDYVDENGALLFQVVRFEPKDFRQRRPDGHGGWNWKLGDIRRVPYRLPELIRAVAAGETIYIPEGEKDCDNIRAIGLAATTNPGGAKKWCGEYSEYLRGADVAVLPDNHAEGREHGDQIVASLRGVAKRIRVLDIGKHWAECPDKGDISDWLAAGGSAEKLKAIVDALQEVSTSVDNPISGKRPNERLKPLTLSELFDLEIKEREMLLSPILPEKGLVMVYAYRGVGKTHVALGIGYTVASGGTFLKWSAPKARRVLLVDGEMPAASLRERLAGIVAAAKQEAEPDAMRVIAGDLVEHGGIGNLADPAVQAELDKHLAGIDLLILDNLSSLTAVIRDNDQESWTTIQQWLLRLRRRGISVLLVHHAGKAGEQRGTSRREDVLDASISLRRPSDYIASEGARFEVHIEKGRAITGDAAKPFEAKLTADPDGRPRWVMHEIADVQKARVEALVADGLSVRDIAEETGIPKSTVHRIKKAMGLSTDAQ